VGKGRRCEKAISLVIRGDLVRGGNVGGSVGCPVVRGGGRYKIPIRGIIYRIACVAKISKSFSTQKEIVEEDRGVDMGSNVRGCGKSGGGSRTFFIKGFINRKKETIWVFVWFTEGAEKMVKEQAGKSE